MIIINLILCVLFLFILIKSANYAIKYSSRLAKNYRIPEFIVSFFIIALISILPETTISIISAIKGQSRLGLGTLLGSNVADLTLVLGIVALFSSNGVKVKSKILRNNLFYLILLLFPLLLGWDGRFSRVDGLILFISGSLFFVKLYFENRKFHREYSEVKREPSSRSLMFLILSMGVLLASAFFTVKYAVNLANDIKLPVILIGLTIISLGVCLPEMTFSLKAIKKKHGDLALGDIMGTVIADATIVLGIVILIAPFNYNVYNLYVTAAGMFFAGIFVITFMNSEHTLSKKEGIVLLLFYVAYIILEFIVTTHLNLPSS